MRLYTTIAFLLSFVLSYAQLNVELLSTVSYSSAGNDVWGYVAEDGREYALMGVETGLSVVDITEPREPVEIEFIDRAATIWRDIKTWEHYAYVTSESSEDGVLVVDMSFLPDSVVYHNVFPQTPVGELNACHNIYIDEFGYAYLAGCNQGAGGVEIFDLKETPGEMVFASRLDNTYSHDVYVKDNKLYNSELRIGQFAIYDVTDKDNLTLLGSAQTPFSFTHNTWLSDDGNTLFTTDERANAPVASYDITDPSSIIKLDEFRPNATIGTNVIPHNVHVWEDWLIVSYYTDGCIIVDASRPDNMVEVGNWDSFLGGGQGFNGAWGAYPFFPSGTIILGDIQEGLIVCGPTYVNAAYLEGRVIDASTDQAIIGAEVSLDALNLEERTDNSGNFKTGTALADTYTVQVSAPGYISQRVDVSLANGEVTDITVALEPSPIVAISGLVVDTEGNPVSNAQISLFDGENYFDYSADENGTFGVHTGYAGRYSFVVGRWGYRYRILDNTEISGEEEEQKVIIQMEKGYEDIFEFDLGWTTSFDGVSGAWVRDNPIATEPPTFPITINPGEDSNDYGANAYVTGNIEDFQESLLFGSAELISPKFNGLSLVSPVLNYDYYFWATTVGGNLTSDEIEVYLTNGQDTVLVATHSMGILDEVDWEPADEIILSDHIALTDSMSVVFHVTNEEINEAVEAGIDNFRISGSPPSSAEEILLATDIELYPNPVADRIYLKHQSGSITADIEIISISGELIDKRKAVKLSTPIVLGRQLHAGVYLLRINTPDGESRLTKFIKAD